jgi:hypothetical protein
VGHKEELGSEGRVGREKEARKFCPPNLYFKEGNLLALPTKARILCLDSLWSIVA